MLVLEVSFCTQIYDSETIRDRNRDAPIRNRFGVSLGCGAKGPTFA